MKKAVLIIIILIPVGFFFQAAFEKAALNKELLQAANDANIKRIKQALKKGADVNARNGIGQTPLHSAAYKERVAIAQLFINKGADINAKDKRGGTPIHWSAITNIADITDMLGKAGAKLEIKDEFGMTPLIWAVSKGKAINVAALLEMGADPNYKNNRGKTALDYAKDRKNRKMIKLLEAALK